MPIPISQNLQLAGQSDVTPWELPYEPMFAALANQQKTFDDNLDNLAKIPELVPKGGVHTTDIRNNLLNEINADLDTARAGMSETGKLDPMIIPRLKAKLTSDPRLQELELDEKYITPNSLKNRYEGVLDNSAHNVLDKNGNWTQLGKGVESLSEIGFIKNEDYVSYLKTQINDVITPEVQSIATHINTNFKKINGKVGDIVDIRTGPNGEQYLVTTDTKHSEEVKRLTEEYLHARILEAPEGGISFARALYDNNTNSVNYFRKSRVFAGKEDSFEAFENEGIAPILNAVLFENKSISTAFGKTAVILKPEESKENNGGGGTYTPEELALIGTPTQYGVDLYQESRATWRDDFGYDVEKNPTVSDLHIGVMNAEKVVSKQVASNSRVSQNLLTEFKKEFDDLPSGIDLESFLKVNDSGFIQYDINSIEVSGSNDQEVADNKQKVDSSITKIQNWLDVNSEAIKDANSKLAVVKAGQENLNQMRDNLYTFAGVDTEDLKKQEDKFFNEVPTDKTIIQVSGNDKSRMFSLQLRNSKLTAQEVRDGDYILSPITKELISSSNTVEFNKTIEENAIRKFNIDKGFIKSPGDPYKWHQLTETEKDEYREEVYSNGKKRLEDFLSAYESKATEAIYGDMEQPERDYIEATLKMQSQLQIVKGSVFYMNDIARDYKPSNYTTAEKHQEILTKAVYQQLKNKLDLAEWKHRFESAPIGDENTKSHINALLQDGQFESKTNSEDGSTKTQYKYSVNGKSFTADVGFRFDIGEFYPDGSPKIMMDFFLNGVSVSKERSKSSKEYGDISDLALKAVEVPLDLDSDLGQYMQRMMYSNDENYRELHNNQRYKQINKELYTTGQSNLSLFINDDNNLNDIKMSWQHVANRSGNGETEYKGVFTIGGSQQTKLVLTAKTPLQIAEIEKNLNAIATTPEIVSEIALNPTGKAKQAIVETIAGNLYNKKSSELTTQEQYTANFIVTTLVENFPVEATGTKTYFQIEEQFQSPLVELNNAYQLNDMVFLQSEVERPIIHKEVERDYINLMTATSVILKNQYPGYKISIESAWRSLENQDDLITKDETGTEKTGAIKNSGHLGARSIDFTFKDDNNNKLSKAEHINIIKLLESQGFDLTVHGEKYHVHGNLKTR